ncbi:MAG: HAMP domain-containing sensor histidine kinase, partial [Candidatus Eremiobacterota bacterium]
FTFLMTGYFFSRAMDHHLDEYLSDSVKLNEPVDCIKGNQIIFNLLEKDFFYEVYPEVILMIIFSTVIAVIVSYFIILHEVKPLKKLREGAGEIGAGNLDYRIDIKRNDVFGYIANSFNTMAESLQKGRMLRKQFFADAAHELKTPITVIKGNLEGMIDGIIPVNEENLKSLLEETEYLNNIIKDIKELALADSGEITLNKKKIDINKIIEASTGMLNMQINAKDINITTDFQVEKPEVSIDPERFNQVIYNLLVNAIKYTPQKGHIKIKTERVLENNIKSVKITIKDSGKGIPPDDLPYIFERFYRVDKSRDRKTGGLGLGLAIVRKIIELHGGTIKAESIINEGSTFYIAIPY